MARDPLPQLLGAVALAATDRVRAAVDTPLGRAGAHAAALIHIQAYPGRPVGALAPVLGISQPAAVKLADRLVTDGLLERGPGPDGRTGSLRLTTSGERAARAALADRSGVLERVLEPLDPEDRERLLPLLAKLVAGLTDTRPGALTVCRMCDRDSCCGQPTGCPLQHTVR
ncbi:MAG TPA: MarR family winged helix-turn-helix transcriptional regulator [Thermoleophilaceae bacterium]|nr:MarR family winged helix-turn-helix transcriptional regulator [Thermoleophilaceae bacterium]